MLTGNARVGRVNRRTETGAMAGGAIALGHQLGRLARGSRGSGQGRRTFHYAAGSIKGRQVGNILVSQRLCNTAHGGVLAIALFVGIECAGNVLGALTGNLGYLVDLRETGLVADDAVAAYAHGVFLGAHHGIAQDFLRLRSHKGHTGDKRGSYGRKQFVHFARTIQE